VRRLIAIVPVLAVVVAAALTLPVGAGSAAGASGPAVPSARAQAHGAHTITLVNRTGQTIWPAAWPGSSAGRTGWTLAAGASVSFRVPEGWNARLWGRTGCHFGAGAGGSGAGHCRTGDCDGRYQCRGWGTIPATLAEYDTNSFDGLDFYDVSMVDGSNLPMYITVTHGRADKGVDADGCLAPGECTTEVQCPAALRVPRSGREVGCISPCARFGTARYCCRGPYAEGCSPAKTWPVDYAQVFKRAEPYAYSWSGDDATSVFTCSGGCDYRITFGVTPAADLGPPE
jgi:hypothetical protein